MYEGFNVALKPGHYLDGYRGGLPELPRHAEAGSSSAGPSIELDEFEQPAMLSATSATRGRSVRMALSPTVVSSAGERVGASSRDDGGGEMSIGTPV